jgi:hypothetical protein
LFAFLDWSDFSYTNYYVFIIKFRLTVPLLTFVIGLGAFGKSPSFPPPLMFFPNNFIGQRPSGPTQLFLSFKKPSALKTESVWKNVKNEGKGPQNQK